MRPALFFLDRPVAIEANGIVDGEPRLDIQVVDVTEEIVPVCQERMRICRPPRPRTCLVSGMMV